MQASCLRCYLAEKRTHHGVLLWEWLLEKANALGVRGGCAFRACGGFGRHHAVHEERFIELAGSSGMVVEFISDDKDIDRLLDVVAQQGIRLYFTRFPVRSGVVNPDADDMRAHAPGV